MTTFLRTSARGLVIAAALVFATSPATAARHTAESAADVRTAHAETPGDADTLDGLLIIAGAAGVVVLAAWAASRIGDDPSAVMG